MNTKHTPGPWEVWPNSQNGQLCISHHETHSNLERAICEVDHLDEANARLIAAAPDLLAALKALPDLHCMADVLNPCWDGRPTDVMGKHWAGGLACETCNARAAIARATGHE